MKIKPIMTITASMLVMSVTSDAFALPIATTTPAPVAAAPAPAAPAANVNQPAAPQHLADASNKAPVAELSPTTPKAPSTAPQVANAAPVASTTTVDTAKVQEPGIPMSPNAAPAPIQTADAQNTGSAADSINSGIEPQQSDNQMGPTAMNNLPANIGSAEEYSGDSASVSGTPDQVSGVDY